MQQQTQKLQSTVTNGSSSPISKKATLDSASATSQLDIFGSVLKNEASGLHWREVGRSRKQPEMLSAVSAEDLRANIIDGAFLALEAQAIALKFRQARQQQLA